MNISQYILVGKFIPNQSFIHHLDARSKILFTILFIINIFMVQTISGYLILLLFIFIAIIYSKLPLSYYIKGLVPILWFILFTSILNLMTATGGTLYIKWYFIHIYSEGIYQTIFIALRLVLLILSTSILTLTTSSIDISIGLERLMKPLIYIKVPVHELALMMSVSLRFIPVLLNELEKIVKAQTARGGKIETGPSYKKIIHLMAIIIPLFIHAIKRAEELSLAMEARGYKGSKGRTRLKESVFTYRDIIPGILIVLLFTIILFIRGF